MTNETATRTGPGYLATVIIAMAMSLFTAFITVAVYDQRYAQKVVTMDLRGFIRQQRDRMVAGELDEAQFRKNLDSLETILSDLPASHMVIMKEVVLRNGREIKP